MDLVQYDCHKNQWFIIHNTSNNKEMIDGLLIDEKNPNILKRIQFESKLIYLLTMDFIDIRSKNKNWNKLIQYKYEGGQQILTFK